MNNKWIKKTFLLLIPFIWICLLRATDSYFSIYLIMGVGSVLSVLNVRDEVEYQTEKRKSALVFGILFSITVTLSNYIGLAYSMILFVSGIVVGWEIYCLLNRAVSWIREKNLNRAMGKMTAQKFALIVFTASLVVNTLYLVLVAYPGNLSPDSFSQINQIMTGSYTNHHPYWHTMLIKAVMSLTGCFTQDISMQIAGYCFFQIIGIALIMSFAAHTVFEITESTYISASIFILYILLPYNITYSCTVWKDVPFSMCILLFSICLLRRSLGIQARSEWLLVVLSLVGIGVLRNNGTIVLVLSVIGTLICLKRLGRSMLFCQIAVLLLSVVLKGPVLSALDVKQGSFVESLSVPIQQIARVVSEDKELSEEQEEMLKKIVDLQSVKKEYLPYISDPIKSLVGNNENFSYFLDHKREYLKLWIDIGLKYPDIYLNAWIQQTKGYWNNGYHYWYLSNGIYGGDLPSYGIEKSDRFPVLSTIFNYYIWLFDYPPLNLFRSIGVQVWLTMFVGIKLISERKAECLMTILPAAAVWLTLLIATPVFCEFRYIYCLFLCLPLFSSCLFIPNGSTNP